MAKNKKNMDEKFIILGTGLILAGFFILFIGTLMNIMNSDNSSQKDSSGNFKSGGVIMIGPIPIGFGTDKETIIVVMILAIVLMIVGFLFFRFFRF